MNDLQNQNEHPLLTAALKAEAEGAGLVGAHLEERLAAASKQLRALEHGHHAMVPLHCNGPSCPMALSCPLMNAGFSYMIGKPCPLEDHLLTLWRDSYVDSLRINHTNMVEVSLASDLAELDIYSMRASNKLAYEDFVSNQCIGISDDGQPQYRKELHVAATWKDMLGKRKLKILDALLATRKAIASVGGGLSDDPSSDAAKVKKLLELKVRALNSASEAILVETAKDVTPLEQ